MADKFWKVQVVSWSCIGVSLCTSEPLSILSAAVGLPFAAVGLAIWLREELS